LIDFSLPQQSREPESLQTVEILPRWVQHAGHLRKTVALGIGVGVFVEKEALRHSEHSEESLFYRKPKARDILRFADPAQIRMTGLEFFNTLSGSCYTILLRLGREHVSTSHRAT
jgi:hypothetical protein